MFLGLISIVASLIGSAVNDYQNGQKDRIGLKYANERLGIWHDHKGKTRLLANNHLAQWYRENGDDIVVDIQTKPWTVYNISEYERRVAFEKQRLIDDGKTVVEWGRQDHKYPYDGKWVRDKATGDMYCIMQIRHTYWYINPANGKLVRLTDGQIETYERMKKEMAEKSLTPNNVGFHSPFWAFFRYRFYEEDKANDFIKRYNNGELQNEFTWAKKEDIW